MAKHKKQVEEIEEGFAHIYSQGRLRGNKILYKREENCTIWYPMKSSEGEKVSVEEEDSGICFDFLAEETDDLIALLKEMKKNKADIYVPNPEEEKKRKEWEQKQETLSEKIKDAFEDLGVHLTPFYWRKSKLMVTRPMPSNKSDELVYKWCGGIYLGPLGITWGRDWHQIKDKLVEIVGSKDMKRVLLKTSKLPFIGAASALAVGFAVKCFYKKS